MQKVTITATATDGSTTTATAKRQDPEEQVDIYMINAGSGDAFYLHFLNKVPQVDEKGDTILGTFEATMIIDGGHSAERGLLMF
jgi:hypothetical protein